MGVYFKDFFGLHNTPLRNSLSFPLFFPISSPLFHLGLSPLEVGYRSLHPGKGHVSFPSGAWAEKLDIDASQR